MTCRRASEVLSKTSGAPLHDGLVLATRWRRWKSRITRVTSERSNACVYDVHELSA